MTCAQLAARAQLTRQERSSRAGRARARELRSRCVCPNFSESAARSPLPCAHQVWILTSAAQARVSCALGERSSSVERARRERSGSAGGTQGAQLTREAHAAVVLGGCDHCGCIEGTDLPITPHAILYHCSKSWDGRRSVAVARRSRASRAQVARSTRQSIAIHAQVQRESGARNGRRSSAGPFLVSPPLLF